MRKYQLYVFCSERGPMTAESFHTLISHLGVKFFVCEPNAPRCPSAPEKRSMWTRSWVLVHISGSEQSAGHKDSFCREYNRAYQIRKCQFQLRATSPALSIQPFMPGARKSPTLQLRSW